MKPLYGSFLFAWMMNFLCASAQAESYAAPLLCKTADAYILATNEGEELQPFWFQHIGSSPFQEKMFEVAAQQTQVFPLAKAFPETPSAVAIKTRPGALWQFQTFCAGETFARKIDRGVSPWKTFELPEKSKTAALSLVNLTQQKNALEIIYFSKSTALGSQKVSLDSEFKRTELNLTLPPTTDHFQVRAEGRWTGIATNEFSREFKISEDTVTLPNSQEARYFLVTSRSEKAEESFVVPLRDPKLIKESLEQIADPTKARLFVAKIEKGFHGVNRDITEPSRAPWSWQAEMIQFGDFASVTCNGTPSVVEERLDDWITNTRGNICFWNYRIKKELTEQEVMNPLSPSLLPLGRVFLRQRL